MNNKIAVFISIREFKDIRSWPNNTFIRIENPSQLYGKKFTCVIEIYGWWNFYGKAKEAFNLLKLRQPELFV